MLINIVIPFYNSSFWLDQCLKSIKLTNFPLSQVFIFNDNSNTEEVDNCKKILSGYKTVKFFNNKGRKGFGGNCNYAASKLSSDYILFLNSDCLITNSTIRELLNCFVQKKDTLMSCCFSNNSPMYSYPIPNGLNFINTADFFNKIFTKNDIYEANTIVGNCLMVDRSKFLAMGGFDKKWGVGYGEETDLQFRALKKGYKSVVTLKTYVYHFGGGSFNSLKNIENIRKKNHSLFFKLWKSDYLKLQKRSNKSNTLPIKKENYFSKKIFQVNYDIIFYLPTINQNIGGIHSVIEICNELILNGFNANIVVVGNVNLDVENFKEPILFSPIHIPDDKSFYKLLKKINLGAIVSTIYSSVDICNQIATDKKIKHIQYIQGVEYLFDNGSVFQKVIDSYSKGDFFIFGSNFIKDCFLKFRKINSNKFKVINPQVNKFLFFPSNQNKFFDFAIFLRKASDKGQPFLLNLLVHFLNKNYKILVFSEEIKALKNKNITFVETPLSKESLSKYFQQVNFFIDFSIHEGFGLMGLEAINCGCRLIYTNNGGINDYIDIKKDNFFVKDPTDFSYIEKLLKVKGINKLKQSKNSWLQALREIL